MKQGRLRLFFLCLGHGYDHLFMLLFPTVVLTLETEFAMPYGELLALATPGFIAFAVGSLPAGWLGDRWSRSGMITIFFIGIGASAVLTGLARNPIEIAMGLTLIGLFASIYHPIGIPMVVEGRKKVGKVLGINGVAGNMGVALAALVAAAFADLVSWRAAFIVPGALAMISGLAYVALVRRTRNVTATLKAADTSSEIPHTPRNHMMRIIAILAIASVFTAIVFHASVIALPKLFDDGLRAMEISTFEVGALVSMVVAVAAFAQIGAGWLIDRYPAKPVWVLVMLGQIPLLILAGVATEYGLLIVAVAMMVMVISEIPVEDSLLVRYTVDAWRSRIYSVKFLLSLGAAAITPLIVGVMHELGGGFFWLFVALGGCAAVVAVAAFWMPGEARAPAPQAVRDTA
jgi:MFS family permease